MRPIGICKEDDDVKDAILDWKDTTTPDPVIEIKYDKEGPNPCHTGGGEGPGGTPGVWGFLFFAGDSQSEAQVREWMEEGYTPEVTPLPDDWWIQARTSVPGANLQPALQGLVDSGQGFSIVL
jgi:hypothetical protein